MFGYFDASSGKNKCSERRYVESVFPVTTCTTYIHRFEFRQVDPDAKIQQSVPESGELINCYAPHKVHSKKSCNFRLRINAFRNVGKHPFSFLPGKGFVFKQMIKYFSHVLKYFVPLSHL